MPPGYSIRAGGELEAQQESFGGIGTAVLVAVFGILAVLILEFGSFRSMLIVAGVIPLGIAGGFIALLVTGYNLSFTATIGLVALIGIEIKNSILLVDFTNQLREQGVALDEAITRAGEIRFLPILLTSLTAIGGLLPLAVQGSGLYSPLAIVIIGGLISSTLLGRLVTPVMYKLLPPRIEVQQKPLRGRFAGGASGPAANAALGQAWRSFLQQVGRIETQALDGREHARPLVVEEARPLVPHQVAARTGRHEHAAAAFLLDEAFVDQLLVTLETVNGFSVCSAATLRTDGSASPSAERALENHRHDLVAQLAINRLAVVPVRIHEIESVSWRMRSDALLYCSRTPTGPSHGRSCVSGQSSGRTESRRRDGRRRHRSRCDRVPCEQPDEDSKAGGPEPVRRAHGVSLFLEPVHDGVVVNYNTKLNCKPLFSKCPGLVRAEPILLPRVKMTGPLRALRQ